MSKTERDIIVEDFLDGLKVKPKKDLCELYLHRLKRALRFRAYHIDELNERGIEVLGGMVSKAYWGASDAGAETEARDINSKSPIPDYLKK